MGLDRGSEELAGCQVFGAHGVQGDLCCLAAGGRWIDHGVMGGNCFTSPWCSGAEGKAATELPGPVGVRLWCRDR